MDKVADLLAAARTQPAIDTGPLGSGPSFADEIAAFLRAN
jgi:hypothetical protein